MAHDLQTAVARVPAVATPAVGRTSVAVTALFAVTAFLGATLLFVVQPMVARIVLPRFGGSATVWSTSSLFFQVVLLLGYVYAHVATTRLGRRAQIGAHLAVLVLPVLVLPVTVPVVADTGSSPSLRLLAVLATMIGLPFAVVSTTGPLLQRWYSWTSAARAEDPYFLFAASNLGSFGGLLAYPVVIERVLTLQQQRTAWSAGLVVLLLLVGACGVVAWTAPGRRSPSSEGSRAPATQRVLTPTVRQQVAWLGLAFLPSALLLAVTSHLSTDIAPVPLLWVVPLAIYLATFVVAFARTSRVVNPLLARAAGAAAVFALVVHVIGPSLSVAVGAVVDLTVLTLVAFVAHSRLAATRPSVEHLTRFYLVVALGGAVGGLLNGLVAPVAFDRMWEYPGGLIVSVLLGVGVLGTTGTVLTRRYGARPGVVLHALALAAGAIGLVIIASLTLGTWWLLLLGGAALAGAAWYAAARPVPAVGAAVLLIAFVSAFQAIGSLETTRTFYGSYRIAETERDRSLSHGSTIHGTQLSEDPGEPTMYYARNGPLGQAMSVLRPQRAGVVGLGAGTIAAYGRPGDVYDFYEIDPQVVTFAEDQRYFTYLRDSAARVTSIVGDGRLRIAAAPEEAYDLIVLDAFSSDAVPVHLLTQEAFDTYASRLGPDGAILVHVSNRYLDLEPVVADAADHLGWSASVGLDATPEPPAIESRWVLVTANQRWTAALRDEDGWRPAGDARVEWTDDFSSVLSVMAGP
ncbi:fused MFS/spermidine synthase [Phycicoccus sp. CSK15P-2]|uniref:fused MFS/spermidine synthase n=1 Tax=Phycicoccus sp. CSK15P-2 TaxID=2807627 RepID=UPI00194F298B|nr:fused MFS/spermidine synthase [Phycicoccus sp. CSK15P-2]MBM6405963.1 fused MFS/spermidine synthase [Phycicoccus sp. CSK15P-2]